MDPTCEEDGVIVRRAWARAGMSRKRHIRSGEIMNRSMEKGKLSYAVPFASMASNTGSRLLLESPDLETSPQEADFLALLRLFERTFGFSLNSSSP